MPYIYTQTKSFVISDNAQDESHKIGFKEYMK